MKNEIIESIKSENAKELEDLLKNKGSLSLDFITSDNETPLIIASRLGNNGLVKQLLQSGANVDFQNETLDTALTISAENGDKSLVELLVKSGANPHLKNEDEKSALDYIRKNNYKDILIMITDLELSSKIEKIRGTEPGLVHDKPKLNS